MKIINPLHIYSWKRRSLLIFILSASLSLWGSIYLDLIGLQIPLLRQLIGVMYLLFIPGILILRFFEFPKLDSIEALLYIIGLSTSFLMTVGFLTNQICLFIGILKPISILPLIITTNFMIFVLSAFCYYKDNDNYDYTYISTQDLFSLPLLFLLLIPFFAIWGAYLVNSYHNNYLILTFIILVSLIILSCGFFNFIPKNLYSVAIFAISISLLFHNSLISTYIWGADIQVEYYLSKIVINNSSWGINTNNIANSMLSIVMLAPFISKICNIDLIWVFKIIYPLLFSLLPVGMYKIFEKQATEEIAFLACLFFISGFMFYTEMLALARQQISELFFILLILLMLNSSIENWKKTILSIIFVFSIVISHYGFSYIFMIALILSLVISKFIRLKDYGVLNVNLHNKLSPKQNYPQNLYSEKIVKINFIVLVFIFALSWYIYTSDGLAFSKVVQIGKVILDQIFNEFLNTQGLEIVTDAAASSTRNITKYLHILSILFISIGVFKLFKERKRTRFNISYAVLSFAYYIICLFGLTVPYFASQLNTSRLYQISLLTLAPFFSIGSISFFNIIVHRKLNIFWTNIPTRQTLRLISIFLATFFLFNSGLIYEIKHEESSSVSINNTHYPLIYSESDISTADWIDYNRNQTRIVYADVGGTNLLVGLISDPKTFNLNNEDLYIPENIYIFTTNFNNKYNQIYIRNHFDQLEYFDLKNWNDYNKINKIYDNGNGKIRIS